MQVHIGDRTATLNDGEFIIINPMETHSTQTEGDGGGMLLLQIPYEFLGKYLPEIARIRFNCSCRDPRSDVVRDLLSKIRLNFENKEDGYMLELYAHIFHLLYTLYTDFSYRMTNEEYGKTEKYMVRLTQILNYINTFYNKDCTMQDVAKDMNLNPSYFSRFFKKYMGMTFMDYLSEVRIEHVFQDMALTDYNITEICKRNGFANYRLFSIKFKERFGTTPGKKLREIRVKANIPIDPKDLARLAADEE
jgi:AraC-like DNA-binding protein